MKICCYLVSLILFFFIGCKQSKNCVIREWNIMDLTRHNYPSLIDTTCNGKIKIVEGFSINESILLDSTFSKIENGRSFKIDTSGIFTIISHSILKMDHGDDQVVKLQFLVTGDNVDQEILVFVVKKKGIIIQQESKYKKILYLKRVSFPDGKTEETGKLSEKIIEDTVLFPPPPRYP